jgi:hypothetical protein
MFASKVRSLLLEWSANHKGLYLGRLQVLLSSLGNARSLPTERSLVREQIQSDRLAVTNTLAYNITVLITTTKSFIVRDEAFVC